MGFSSKHIISISLLISLFSVIATEKAVVLKNYNGPFSLELAETNADAEYLSADNCTITTYPLGLFAIMSKVKKLFVTHSTFLQPVDHHIYENAPNLEILVFTHNKIDDWPLEIFHNSSFRKVIIRGEKKVLRIPKNFASESQRLKHFQCSECKIRTIEEGAFNNLDKLETLDLHHNLIENIPNGVFDPLVNLKKLNLEDNRIVEFSTDNIKELKNLKEIDLSYNSLEKLNLLNVEKVLPNLKTVYLEYTRVPETVIEEHRKQTNIRFVTDKDHMLGP